jgi:predicted amidohydrolase YtcJ
MRRFLPLLLSGILACGGPGMPTADVILFGPVWTGNPDQPTAGAVAISGDTILAVGDSSVVASFLGRATRSYHVEGLITPGLADDHVHFSDGGMALGQVDLRDAATPAEFIQRIAAFAKTLPAGQWILGGIWDHENFPGAELPRREWIDSITPDHPVFIQRLDGHMGLANTKALELAGVTRATSDVPGGTIVRDRDGTPTGIFKDEAMGPLWAVIPAPSGEVADSAVVRAMRHANALGITAVAAVSAPWYEIAATRRIREAGQQSLRVSFYPALAGWQGVADTVAARGPGDDWIRVAGVKGFVDGSLGSTTALFFEPYLDEPRSRGLMVTPEDSLRQWIGAADSAGLQVVVHAIGERANALLLDIFDSVMTAHGSRDRRFRIEHAQHLRPEEIARLAPLGVLASMQPFHAADDGRWAYKRIRPRQLEGTYAFRSVLDAGATLLFGSDWTVAPLSPFDGLWAAVARETVDGANPDGWMPAQRITLVEALTAYTRANAYATFAEHRWGTIRPGMLADVAVMDRDLRSVPPGELREAQAVMTIVGGRVVYQRPAN